MHTVDLMMVIEAHWGVRRPKWVLCLNQDTLQEKRSIVRIDGTTEQITTQTQLTFGNNHCDYLSLTMNDKTNQDLLLDEHGTMIADHYLIVKEIALDGFEIGPIKFTDTVFQHSMPQSWISDMHQKGIMIPEQYRPGTEIRLNGIMTLPLYFPVWQWWCDRMQQYQPGTSLGAVLD